MKTAPVWEELEDKEHCPHCGKKGLYVDILYKDINCICGCVIYRDRPLERVLGRLPKV